MNELQSSEGKLFAGIRNAYKYQVTVIWITIKGDKNCLSLIPNHAVLHFILRFVMPIRRMVFSEV